MTPTPFPWPWRGALNRRLSLVALIWILALNLWGLIAIDFLPISRHSAWEPSANLRAPLLARYDSGWYDGIIRFGYGPPPAAGKESAHAFFPVYPEIARFVHLMTGIDSFQSGLLVTYAALLLALPLFLEEARFRFGDQRAWRTLPFLLLYPPAFFLAAVYTESVFLLLALLAFREVRFGRLQPALLWAFLTGLTRAPAVVLGAPLALTWWLSRAKGERRVLGFLLLGAAPTLGVASWILGIGLAKGEPGLFFRSMGAWRKEAGDPEAGFLAFWKEGQTMYREGRFRSHPGAIVPYVHFVLFSFVGAIQLRARRWADASWSLGLLALSIFTGTSAGIPRYTLTIYPGHFALFELTESRPVLRRILLGAYLALLLLNVAFFVNWHFVS
ncbi:MAG: hypothetical protein ABIT01_20140 [Thermoanaerobaculia bacterium]